jgi:hypothetical protein
MSEISLLKSAFKEDQRLEELIQESMQHFSPDELLSFSPVAVSAFPSLPREDQDSSNNFDLIKLFHAPLVEEQEDLVIEQSTILPPLSHMASPCSLKKASPVMINLKLIEIDQVESDDDLS